MTDRIEMSASERKRAKVLELLSSGVLNRERAREALGVSARQLRRLQRRYERDGDRGLVHRGRGRPAANRTAVEVRERLVALATGRYRDFNDSHLQETLAVDEQIVIGRETLRRILREAGKRAKRRRRPVRYRARREPAACRGELMLWDGSKHRWLGNDQPECVLMLALDDASGEILDAFFTGSEGTLAYLRLLAVVLTRHGAPLAVYHDRHTSLVRNDGYWTLEEQLADRQLPTQVGQALEEVGIRQILSYTPQGRGRIERLFGTAQDRLLAELRLHEIHTLEAASVFLRDWIVRFNRRFGRRPTRAGSAFRKVPSEHIHQLASLRYQRSVAGDNTLKLGDVTIQIPPGPRGRSYARARTDVRQHLDGTWTVHLDGHRIATHPATPVCDPRRVRLRTRRTRKAKAADEVLLVYLPEDTVAATPLP